MTIGLENTILRNISQALKAIIFLYRKEKKKTDLY